MCQRDAYHQHQANVARAAAAVPSAIDCEFWSPPRIFLTWCQNASSGGQHAVRRCCVAHRKAKLSAPHSPVSAACVCGYRYVDACVCGEAAAAQGRGGRRGGQGGPAKRGPAKTCAPSYCTDDKSCPTNNPADVPGTPFFCMPV
jgi:hypothetical protein